MKKITWLHLSDLHIKKSDNTHKQNIIINDLIDDIKYQITNENLKIDFIFISGDVFDKGNTNEMNYVETILKRIATTAQVELENIFFVPGNHDIVRSASNNQNSSDLSKNASVALKDFKSFVNRFYKTPIYDSDSLFYETKRNVSGKIVSIIGLNTAFSAISDVRAGEVILGESQVRKALKQSEDADMIISLMHHPFSWLSENDNNVAKALLSKRSDFILTGHVHAVSDIGRLSIFGNAFCITAGACYAENEKYSNSYNITECDLESGTGKIIFRQYINIHGGYWSRDNTIDQTIPDGIVSFQLPSRIQIDNVEYQRFFKPTLPSQAADKLLVEEIPMPKIPKALINDIKDGKCYLFAGAGVSKDAGLPDWLELLNNGIETLDEYVALTSEEIDELQSLLSSGEFAIVGDYLRYRLGEQWFSSFIKKISFNKRTSFCKT